MIPLPRSEALARPLRAALYGRASRDRNKRGHSVKDQFAIGEMVCAEYGWTIVDYYKDLDRSASRRAKKVREHYERMVADMEAGLIDVVVYAEKSRLSRDMAVSIDLRDLCERTDIKLYYDGRLYDMRVPSDFREFTRDSVQAEEEGEGITGRIVRTVNLNAKRGGAHGPVAFGFKREYDPDTGELLGQGPHPQEGPVVIELFRRADEKQSLASMVPLVRTLRPDMDEQGIKVILKNKAYIGIRVHKDQEYKAQWDGFIDEAVFWRVQAMLDDPMRRTTHTSGVQHLLTGIALCVDCRAAENFKEARVQARPAQPKYRRGSQYRCRVNHLTIMEARLDAYVEDAVLRYLASPRARKAFRRKDSSGDVEREQARHAAMLGQLTEAREQATDFDSVTGLPKLSAVSLASLEQKILPLLAASEAAVRGMLSAGDPLLDRLLVASPDELDDMWSDVLTLEQRRHVVRCLVRVEVRRARSKGRGLDVGHRVGLIFLGEPGFAEWPKLVEASTSGAPTRVEGDD